MRNDPIPTARRSSGSQLTQLAFIERGLASRNETKLSGKYVTALAVLSKVAQRLNAARNSIK